MTSNSKNREPKDEPTVSAAQLLDVYHAVLSHNISQPAIAEKTGLSKEHLTSVDLRIPAGQALRLWQLLLESSGDPLCGFRLGMFVKKESVGVLGNLILSSASLNAALKRLLRFYRLLTEVEAVQLNDFSTDTMLYSFHCLESDLWVPPMTDRSLSAAVAWANAFAGKTMPIKTIHMRRREDGNSQAITDLFSYPVKFASDYDGIEFTKDLLGTPGVNHNDYIGTVLESRARVLHSELDSQTNLERKIRDELTALLPEGEAGIDTVADALGMNRSTIYRRLKKEGLTFSGLLEDQRKKLSAFYINKQGLSKTETAVLLGYSELSAYLRAERRWS